MGDKSNIEWTRGDDGTPGATWNPIRGFAPNRWQCATISPGCDHCYASTMNHRWGGSEYPPVGGDPRTFLDAQALELPLTWKRPRRVFVCSMTDLFGEWVSQEWIDQVLNVMVQATQHQFQVLTKRPSRMAEMLPRAYDRLYGGSHARRCADNIWLGTTIELNRYAWRADPLRATPAAVRFVSAEPLLGPLPSLNLAGIDWLITGGESGHGHRPLDPEWVRDLRDRCQASGVAFFHKQNGGRTHGEGGRELDGRTYSEYPEPRRELARA